MSNFIIYGQPYVENSDNENIELVTEDPDCSSDTSENINIDSSLKKAPATSVEENNEKSLEITESAQEELQPTRNQHRLNLPPYNTRALPRHANTYELEKFERKVLVIFNQENIDGYKPRLGTDKDVEALTRTFENLGFEIIVHKDFTKSQILFELRNFFDQDFTDVGCITIAVLTHGNEYGILRAKDRAYNEVEITEYLESSTNPTLLTKPKFLIVQACRGTKTNIGVPVRQSVSTTHKDQLEDIEPYTMPSEADQLILHSSYFRNPSFRNTIEGSWLIQSLCKHINALAPTTDLESIIVAVKKEVAIDRSYEEYSKRTNDIEINKQIPVMTSTLIRKLYLRKFGDPLDLNLNSMMSFSSSDTQDAIISEPDTPNVIPSEMQTIESSMTKLKILSSKRYFVYLVKCLGFYVEENPEDTVAQSYLQVSNTFGKGKKFDAAKEEMINALCKYFDKNEDKIQFSKYLYIKKK